MSTEIKTTPINWREAHRPRDDRGEELWDRSSRLEREQFERFVNDPTNKPNLNFWFSRPAWLVYEAAALILGVDPEKIPELSDTVMAGKPPSKCAVKDYIELVTRFNQAVAVHILPEDFTPIQALDFVKSNGYLPIPDFIKAYLESIEKPTAQRSSDVSSTPATKQLNSALKLIAGMIAGSYNPSSETPFGKIVSDIKEDMDRAGLTMDRDTIKKYVEMALEMYGTANAPPNSD